MFYTAEEQRRTYNDLVQHFKKLPEVVAIIQRGSLAKGEEDRASDLDILFVVRDSDIKLFTKKFTSYLGDCCELLVKEPWFDTIVPDFGGFGVVYFIKKYNKLIQLDVYLCPESNSGKILNFNEKKILFSRESIQTKETLFDVSELIKDLESTSDLKFQLIFEFYLVLEIYAKQVYRANPTLALKYRYMTIEALVKLIRFIFKPEKLAYKMYDWVRDFGNINSPVIRKFERNLVLIDIFSDTQLMTLLSIAESLFNESNLQEYYKTHFKNLDLEVRKYISVLLNPEYE